MNCVFDRWETSRSGGVSLRPDMHLARDEALLNGAEDGQWGEWLRLWESAEHFVVLGAGGRRNEEVDLETAAGAGVPVLRRCSGGGTVLQGQHCLNFALVLDTVSRPECKSVDGTTHLVLNTVAEALRVQGIESSVRGTSDLAVSGRKVSGNAQRRRKRFVLFHGTLLLEGFDLDLMSRVLKHPPRQPDWREQRGHLDFTAPLNLDRDQFWLDMKRQWEPEPASERQLLMLAGMAALLVQEKYSQSEWNESL
jgi:lipoate-protein ligase A